MKVRLTYPVKTGLVTIDRWPLRMGDLEVEWLGENGEITEVQVTAPTSDRDVRPAIGKGQTSGVSLEINAGHSERVEEIEQLLRTTQGLADLFGPLSIDFDHGKFEWLPETKEEEANLSLFSISRIRNHADIYRKHLDTFDLLARSVAAAGTSGKYEIPLSFVRRGMRDMKSEKYIEAYYNFFFFLETLFSPGFSDPKKVKRRFKLSKEVISGIKKMRENFTLSESQDDKRPAIQRLLALTDEKLIDHFVEIRGHLHHNAPRGPAAWHPDKPHDFESEVRILQNTIHAIALDIILPKLFSPSIDAAFVEGAKRAGAALVLRVEITGRTDTGERWIESFPVSMVGRHLRRQMFVAAQTEAKNKLAALRPNDSLDEIKVTDTEGRNVFAVYSCLVATPISSRRPPAHL